MNAVSGRGGLAGASPVDPVLERLKHLHPRVIDLSLDRLARLLAALGDPQHRLPPVAHVAGTNGKGSTVAFLRALIEAAGLRVHVYTSPHLVRFNERIRLAGALIAEADLAAVLAECEAANAGRPITFFEITTAAAFVAFSRVPADAVVLETGLGGRLDATNVVERPAVTAITRISFDHRQFLGDTLAAIAGEKAGILKPGVPAVIAPQPSAEVAATLAAAASAVGAPLLAHGAAWDVEALGGGFRFREAARGLAVDLPAPGLVGAHQIVNAGTALACLGPLAAAVPALRDVGRETLARGLAAVSWPGRLQRLGPPLAGLLPPDWELWLDGGHNDSAGEVLAAQARIWGDRPLDLVFGMLSSKEPAAFLGPLAPYVRALTAVPVPGEEAGLTPAAAAAAARAAGISAVATASDPAAALRGRSGAPARVLICGSLYLAGSVLREWGL